MPLVLDRRRRVALLGGSATATVVIALAAFGGPLVLPSGATGLIGGADASTIPAAATPLAAAASTPYAAMRGCHVGYSTDEVASGCVFGATTAKRTVVLVGDSHAAQWFPALELLARSEHFRLIAWTKSGCPLAPGVHIYLPAIGRQYGECRDWSANVIRRLQTTHRVSLIIDARTSTYLPQVLGADGESVSRATAGRLWGAGFAAGVADLQRVASRVIVLRDTPHAPQDIPACISWNPSDPLTCDFPQPRDRHADDAEYAAERAAGIPPSVYVDPAPAVCQGAVCKAAVNGIITYRDDNHLTAAYSAAIRRRFAQLLTATEHHAV